VSQISPSALGSRGSYALNGDATRRPQAPHVPTRSTGQGKSPAQVGCGLEERCHERLAVFYLLAVLAIPLPETDEGRHIARELPGRVQVAFDFVGGGAVDDVIHRAQRGQRQLGVDTTKCRSTIDCVKLLSWLSSTDGMFCPRDVQLAKSTLPPRANPRSFCGG
jgi:hypothetical protein